MIALLVGAVAAFPAPPRRRIRAILLGFVLVSIVNTLRVGSLSLLAGRPQIFDLLHHVVWPAILITLVTLYVFAWMRSTIRSGSVGARPTAPSHRGGIAPLRFALWLTAAVAVFFAASSWYLDSHWLLTVSSWAALSGAVLLHGLGIDASVTGAVLSTPHGGFVVTPICMATPLIPVYFAALVSLPMPGRRRLALLVVAPFLFFALGTLRLLALALPDALVHSRLEAIHAFNQVVFAALLVIVAALWRGHGSGERIGRRWRRAGLALALGAAVALTAIPLLRLLLGPTVGVAGFWLGLPISALPDPQGALAMSPAFELALCAALVTAFGSRIRSRQAAAAAGILIGGHVLLVLGLGELWRHWAWSPGVPAIRGWAVMFPILVAAWLCGWRRLAAIGRRGPDFRPVNAASS